MARAWMVTVDMRYHNPCSSFDSYCTNPRLCGVRIHRLYSRGGHRTEATRKAVTSLYLLAVQVHRLGSEDGIHHPKKSQAALVEAF
jgi:hypothetical protein